MIQAQSHLGKNIREILYEETNLHIIFRIMTKALNQTNFVPLTMIFNSDLIYIMKRIVIYCVRENKTDL